MFRSKSLMKYLIRSYKFVQNLKKYFNKAYPTMYLEYIWGFTRGRLTHKLQPQIMKLRYSTKSPEIRIQENCGGFG